MIKALLQHIQLLLLLKHDGQGLQTGKSFTFILLLVCLAVSLVSEELTTVTIVSHIFLLICLYILTKKEVVNGVLLCMLVFLIVNVLLPPLGIFALLWVFLAMTKMQNNYRNKN